jgi:hypothetical protein
MRGIAVEEAFLIEDIAPEWAKVLGQDCPIGRTRVFFICPEP